MPENQKNPRETALSMADSSPANRLPGELAAGILDAIQLGILITDTRGVIQAVNPAFTRMTGYTADEALGKTPGLLKSGRQSAEFYSELWETLMREGYWQGVVWNRRKNGEHYAELLSISSLRNAEGEVTHYVGSFSDITRLKEHEMQLEYLAHYDSLTQLPNRVLLRDRLQQAMARTRRGDYLLGVCVLDIDNFKPVNDQLGHALGDELLVLVAQRINTCLRDTDTLARVGGDEFVVLLNDLPDADTGCQTLKRLLQALTPPFLLAGHHLQVAVSIGMTLYPDDKTHLENLLRHADKAMYQAKQAGGNAYRVYCPASDSDAPLFKV
jgi:diguanylate cyclase (GGDEF)-like protein/PAS domain S-box-containing protein